MREVNRMRLTSAAVLLASGTSGLTLDHDVWVPTHVETKPAGPPSKADGLIQMLIDQGVTDQTIFEKVRGTFSEDECRQLMNAFIEATGSWY